MVRFSKRVGSFRIQLILLKTKNWKHYGKIIFKCVNSAVGPIFNIFLLKKVVVGPVSCALFLLQSESICMNGVVKVHTRWKKKKGNVKLKTQTRYKPNPNGHVFMLIFLMEVVVLVYNQIWSQNLLISQSELLINALRLPINQTLNYQGQGFSPN